MILLGTAVGIKQVIKMDATFAKACLRKYLSQYNDADAVIARMTQLRSIPEFEDIFHASIEAYMDFHNGADLTSAYSELAGIYLDSGNP